MHRLHVAREAPSDPRYRYPLPAPFARRLPLGLGQVGREPERQATGYGLREAGVTAHVPAPPAATTARACVARASASVSLGHSSSNAPRCPGSTSVKIPVQNM